MLQNSMSEIYSPSDFLCVFLVSCYSTLKASYFLFPLPFQPLANDCLLPFSHPFFITLYLHCCQSLITNFTISSLFFQSYLNNSPRFSSVEFSHSISVSNSLQPYELQHTRPPCPSPAPGVHPNPCPSSR